MKNAILLIMIVLPLGIMAQKKDRTDAYMYNKNGVYDKAMYSIEKCVNHPDFSSMPLQDQAKSWHYRAVIYRNLSQSMVAYKIVSDVENVESKIIESVQRCNEADPNYAAANLKDFFKYLYVNQVEQPQQVQAVKSNHSKPNPSKKTNQSQGTSSTHPKAKDSAPSMNDNTTLSDVDTNIPKTNSQGDDTFVLIIANEDYLFIDKVEFAIHDGETFKEYCIKTLGVPERQVRYCPNASYGIISGGVDWLRYALENFEGSRGIVYYCGHGIPDEKTGEAYIIPVDGKGTNMATCISLNELYKTLAVTNADNITYFMDACFTGANKEGSMLVAARGVAREPKRETLSGKSIVFSASSGDETAMTYEEKGHGLFTYYLLKKLQETAGDVSYEDLADYISKNVKKYAFLLNEKPQNPVVATSPAATNIWREMRLK